MFVPKVIYFGLFRVLSDPLLRRTMSFNTPTPRQSGCIVEVLHTVPNAWVQLVLERPHTLNSDLDAARVGHWFSDASQYEILNQCRSGTGRKGTVSVRYFRG